MYEVTIKREDDKYVARDSDGARRAFATADRTRTGMDLARYLYHESEILHVYINEHGFTVATIRDPCDPACVSIPKGTKMTDQERAIILRALSAYAIDLNKHEDHENLAEVLRLIHEYTHQGE